MEHLVYCVCLRHCIICWSYATWRYTEAKVKDYARNTYRSSTVSLHVTIIPYLPFAALFWDLRSSGLFRSVDRFGTDVSRQRNRPICKAQDIQEEFILLIRLGHHYPRRRHRYDAPKRRWQTNLHCPIKGKGNGIMYVIFWCWQLIVSHPLCCILLPAVSVRFQRALVRSKGQTAFQ